MIFGDFPPNSRVTFLMLLLAASFMTSLPISVDPVKATWEFLACAYIFVFNDFFKINHNLKDTLSMSWCLAIAAPAVGPNPGMMFTTPAGKPAWISSFPEIHKCKKLMSLFFFIKIHLLNDQLALFNEG